MYLILTQVSVLTVRNPQQLKYEKGKVKVTLRHTQLAYPTV